MMYTKKHVRRALVALTCFLLAVFTLASCAPGLGTAPSLSEMGGTDIAKLLLADRRLDSARLGQDNIFESGAETLNTLAVRAISYSTHTTRFYDSEDRIGNLTISGSTAEWSDFVEYNNSYSYFENITSIIIDIARRGADFIDEAKETVTVVDCWLQDGKEKYYLAVDENSETICREDANGIFICRRSTNEQGRTVYDLYTEQEHVYERMKYIPDERYELTQVLSFEDTQELYFVADHSKGYWETLCVNDGGGRYDNENYTIMKDDICYSVDYDVASQTIQVLGIMSADTETDLFEVYNNPYDLFVVMQFSGFDGIDRVTADAADVDENGNFTGSSDITVHLSSGGTLIPGSAQGGVLVDRIYVSSLADGYIGSCDLIIQGDTVEERWANFSSFLKANGLTCRRDWNTVVRGVGLAQQDAEDLIRYYQWNGCVVTDMQGILAAVEVERSTVAAMKDLYTAVKDKPVVKRSRANNDISDFDFAEIKVYDSKNVVLDNGAVDVGHISLTTDDTTLMEKGNSYVVALAVASCYSGDMVIVGRGASATYDGASRFTVSADDIHFDLPTLSEGEYTIVAFLATADGIMVSDCAVVGADAIGQDEVIAPGKNIRVEPLGTDAITQLILVYREAAEHVVDLRVSAPLSYADFIDAISVSTFVYGTPSADQPERQVADDFIPVDADAPLTEGTYRMAYTVSNGDSVTEGYVYIRYTAG